MQRRLSIIPEVYSCKRGPSRGQQQGGVRHDELEVETLGRHLPVLVLEHVQEDFLAFVEIPMNLKKNYLLMILSSHLFLTLVSTHSLPSLLQQQQGVHRPEHSYHS